MYRSELKSVLSLFCKMKFKLKAFFLIRKLFIKSIWIMHPGYCRGGERGWGWCGVKASQRSSFLHKCTDFDISFSHTMSPKEGHSTLPGQPVPFSHTKEKTIC